jgi:N,N'-diacetyllegionaminate synthase
MPYDQSPPFVIAEVGVNHNGDIQDAKRLCQVARDSGASAVKFQTYSAARLASLETPKVSYQRKYDVNTSHFSMLQNLELSYDAHLELKKFCDELQLEFMSTPYGIEDAVFLNQLGVNYFKTASADIVDIPLHNLISTFRKRTFISTGMASINEIREVVDIYREKDCDFVLLHTTSEYPTKIENVNLNRMSRIAELFECEVGFSDHSIGFLSSCLAVALGASTLEKHITLDKNQAGPDHMSSSTPEEFTQFVTQVRIAASALGSNEFRRTLQEEDMANTSRKSLHVRNEIAAGTVITLDDLELKRPGNGVLWAERHQLVGKTSKKTLAKGQKISLIDLEEK